MSFELLNERLKGRYISQAGLKNLDNYGYHGEDRSFFGNLILKHWWNWAVERVPMWFAPNLLTLLGLISNVIGYVLVLYYSPLLTEGLPRWVCFVNAFLLFAYQTLDNVDGKQARRTGSSSPLGELFDHGCDSITMGILALVTGAAVRLGPLLTLLGLLVGWGPFYLAHWEEYHTGILIMGKFNGPTEAQLVIMAMLIFTGIAGSGVWVQALFSIHHTKINLKHIMFLLIIITSIITVCQNIYKVLSLRTRTMPLLPTILQLIPFFVLVILSFIWSLTEYRLLQEQPHIVLMSLSLVFAYLTSRLIVNRVCKEPTQHFHGIFVPLFLAAFVGIIEAALKVHDAAFPLAIALLVVSGIQFIYFSICVILQLTKYLGIQAFTIVPVDPSLSHPPVTTQRGSGAPLLSRQESDDSMEIHVEDGAHSIE